VCLAFSGHRAQGTRAYFSFIPENRKSFHFAGLSKDGRTSDGGAYRRIGNRGAEVSGRLPIDSLNCGEGRAAKKFPHLALSPGSAERNSGLSRNDWVFRSLFFKPIGRPCG